MAKRIFLFVLDSLGIGAAPDADSFHDEGADTLGSLRKSSKLDTPNLEKMGFYQIDGLGETKENKNSKSYAGSFGRLQEVSNGKDTTIGHWEIAGLESKAPLPTFPDGFPEDFIKAYEARVGRKVVCNKPYSGTSVLTDYGMHHLETGDLIVYTSADSVFQVAANEDVVPVEQLYEYCSTARDMLTGDLGVGRVIARPFVGTSTDNFKRTSKRHDFSLNPPGTTMLDLIGKNKMSVIGVGKIYDIFNGVGLTETHRTGGNTEGMQVAASMQKQDFTGLCFINLVDFDMLYGHRRDIDGYAMALTEFDHFLGEFVVGMEDEDVLMITADHGCDPGFTKTTDHTREYVPFLIYGNTVEPGVDLGTVKSFATIASTVCEYLGLESQFPAAGVWNRIVKK